MYIQVNHDNMQALYDFIRKFIGTIYDYTGSLNDFARKNIDWHINQLQSYMNNVYNPQLRSLKDQSNSLYKAFLSVREVDKVSAARLYAQYLDKKTEVAILEKQLSQSNF